MKLCQVSFFKKFFPRIFKNPLLAGSLALFVGGMIFNFGSYLYHLLMGRMLGPANYGALTALISLLSLFSIFSSTLNTTVVKFITIYKAKKNYSQMLSLLIGLTKFFSLFGFLVILFFVLGKEEIASFLNLPFSFPVTLVGILMFFSFLSATNDGVLRGLLNFNFLAANLVFTVILKVSFGFLLVSWGFSVTGALGAIVLASIFPYLVSFLPLRFLGRYREKMLAVNWKELGFYASPVFLAIFGLNSLFTTDIILVKHFFPPFEAGLYASLSVLGKIIFFASSVVNMVMFPLVSEKFENGRDYRGLLTQSLGLVLVISLVITASYFLFPKVMIQALYGPSYLEAAPYLGLFGLFISFYSLSAVLMNFFLSIRKLKSAFISLAAAFGQIALIWFFHFSLLQVIGISIFVSILLLAALLLYFSQSEKEERKEKIPLGYRPGL